ncbi:MAG: response regulator [Anaerolineales bacterium]
MSKPDGTEPIRILLVDDHQMVRQGLVFFLTSQNDLSVVGEAENGLQALEMAKELQPDVVLMDLMMPEMDGLQAIRAIKSRFPEMEVVALTSFIDDQKVVSAIQNGAAGYLMKDASPKELAQAVRSAARGEVYLHPEAARRLAREVRTEQENDVDPDSLTERELDVLRHIARGLSNQDIADTLKISIKTVKAHVSHILSKLQLDSRVQAALYALRHNIVPMDEI